MIKNVRILILLAIVILSIALIVLPFLTKKSGVGVVEVNVNNKCSNIKIGDIITQVNDKNVDNIIDFSNIVKNLLPDSYATMIVNNGPGGCSVIEAGNVGLGVKDIPSNSLKFGLEIGGGITNLYESTNNGTITEKVVGVVKKRIEAMRLQDVKAYQPEGKTNYLKISGINDENFEILTAKGEFTAKIVQNINLKNGTGNFVVEDTAHSVSYSNGIIIDGSKRKIGEEFLIENIKFYISNFTNNSVALEALFFSNEDVLKVYDVASYASYNSDMQQYQIYIPIGISDRAANRFANLTKRMNTKVVGQNILLDGSLDYSLDGKAMIPLPMTFESAGKVRNTIAIINFEKSLKSANYEKLMVETALQSGSLPATLKLADSEKYTGSLEYIMKNYLPLIAGVFLLSILIVGRIKIKSWVGSLFFLLLSISEIIFVWGIIGAVQMFGYSWIIDIETITGFFVIVIIGFLDSYVNLSKKNGMIFRMFLFLISFTTLFTYWKGFGIALLASLALKTILTDNIRKNFGKFTTKT